MLLEREIYAMLQMMSNIQLCVTLDPGLFKSTCLPAVPPSIIKSLILFTHVPLISVPSIFVFLNYFYVILTAVFFDDWRLLNFLLS